MPRSAVCSDVNYSNWRLFFILWQWTNTAAPLLSPCCQHSLDFKSAVGRSRTTNIERNPTEIPRCQTVLLLFHKSIHLHKNSLFKKKNHLLYFCTVNTSVQLCRGVIAPTHFRSYCMFFIGILFLQDGDVVRSDELSHSLTVSICHVWGTRLLYHILTEFFSDYKSDLSKPTVWSVAVKLQRAEVMTCGHGVTISLFDNQALFSQRSIFKIVNSPRLHDLWFRWV